MMDIDTVVVRVSFELNGQPVSLVAPPLKRLLDVLRHDLGLMGTKNGCGEGDCGSCTVLIDGLPVVSCLVPIVQVDNAKVRTVESLADPGRLHPLQKALMETGGAQCGGCLSGFQMAACGYLDAIGDAKAPNVEEAELRQAVAGVLCRCTGYQRMIEAMRRVVAGGV
jgi:carbon-monoxide dehydrogenase small subunit